MTQRKWLFGGDVRVEGEDVAHGVVEDCSEMEGGSLWSLTIIGGGVQGFGWKLMKMG